MSEPNPYAPPPAPRPAREAQGGPGILGPDAERRRQQQFPFVASTRPLIQGTLGALLVIAALGLWARASGRLVEIDATYCAIVIGALVGSITLVIGRTWLSARKAAAALGCLEVDDAGVRWHRGDGALGFDVAWRDLHRATFDAGTSVILLARREGPPIVLGVLASSGGPAGFVVLARFDELVARISPHLPTSPHTGEPNLPVARRVIRTGLVNGVVGVALYAANVVIGDAVGWTRFRAPFPILLGVFGAIAVGAGLRIRAGHGPITPSSLRDPAYSPKALRFVGVCLVANFVLLVLLNPRA